MSRDTAKRGKRLRLAGQKRLTAGLAHHRWPVLAPDAERIAFAVGEGFDQCWVITDRKGRVGRIFEGPADGGACFGPDGSFAFGRKTGGASEIWYAPGPSAAAVRLLGGDGKTYQGPALSPDGKTLAFAGDADGKGQLSLQLLEIATGQRMRIANDGYGSAGRPAFATTGELYFDGAFDGRLGIYRLPAGHAEAVRVSPLDVSYRRPAPLGGGLVLAERHVEGKSAVRLVLLDEQTGEEHKLSDLDEAREPSAAIVQDGKAPRIAFIALGAEEPRRFEVHLARLRGLPEREPRAVDGGAA